MFAYRKIACPERHPGIESAGEAALEWGPREWIMLRRWGVILAVIGLGLLLEGCTKCGPIWDDWMQPSRSCRSDHL
jgi:hypothetical protein